MLSPPPQLLLVCPCSEIICELTYHTSSTVCAPKTYLKEERCKAGKAARKIQSFSSFSRDQMCISSSGVDSLIERL